MSLLAANFDASGLEGLKTGGPGKIGYTDLGRLVANGYTALVIFTGIAAFIFFVLGGFQYVTSGGDKAGVEAAQKKITYAILGLAIVVLGYAVAFVAQFLFGVSIVGGIKIPKP